MSSSPASSPYRCSRCGQQLTETESDRLPDWMVTTENAHVVDLSCPDCMTGEETAECAVREAIGERWLLDGTGELVVVSPHDPGSSQSGDPV